MNENRMKTAINTGGVSSPPAQKAVWGVNIRAEHGSGSEKQGFVVEKWLVNPSDGSIIAKTRGKTQFGP
jgi:hypothetical protein